MKISKSKAIFQVILVFIAAFLGMIPLVWYIRLTDRLLFLTLRIPLYWVIVIVPLLIIDQEDKRIRDYMDFTKENLGKQVLVGFAIGLVMSIFLSLIPLLQRKQIVMGYRYNYKQFLEFLIEFIYYMIGVSLTEEFLFRGFIYKRLQVVFEKEYFVVIISSLIFGLFHLVNGNLIQPINTTLIGIFFCLCKLKIKNCTLLSLVIVHGVYNFLLTFWPSVLNMLGYFG